MSKVAVLKTRPESVLGDYRKLMHLAEYKKHLLQDKETILKLNLSWSLYYPACSTQPWQLEGVLKTMLDDGYRRLHPVENRTVVTDVWKGAKGNKWLPILRRYGQKYEPLTAVEWVDYKPKGELLALDEIFPGDHKIPKMFIGKNVVHFPTIKCVHPDTEILQADGEVVRIEEMVEKVHENCEVNFTEEGDAVANSNHLLPSMVGDGRMMNSKALQFWKTPSPDGLFSIRTKTGREVTVSEVHPFLTPEGWKQAKEIKEKDRIAVLRRIDIKGKRQKLPEIKQPNEHKVNLDKIEFKDSHKYSAKLQKKALKDYYNGVEVKEIYKNHKIGSTAFKYLFKKYNLQHRIQVNWNVKAPSETSTDFWRWLGYFIAEGYIDKNNYFRFVNHNEKIQKDYTNLTKKLFGVDLIFKRGKDSQFRSNILAEFFQKLGLSMPLYAGNKTVPSLLYKCTNEEIVQFIQGYFDGDGCLAKRKKNNYSYFTVNSKSEKLIYSIQSLLLRLDIISFKNYVFNKSQHWNKKKRYHILYIYGEELAKLFKLIKLKKYSLESLNIIFKRKKDTNWDTVPLNPKLFRDVREKLKISRKEISPQWQTVADFEIGRRGISRDMFKKYLSVLIEKDKEKKFTDEINYFKFLISEDIAWDPVVEIKSNKADTDFLYDLTVPGTNNFVGNGIILHNTHGHTVMTGSIKNSFGGLITKRRHHCHKAIHEVLVDLLTIQKEIHPGMFAVMDGTVAGDGAGPRTMVPKVKNTILASGDQVAIDAISAKMMGYDPLKIKFIKLAHDKGLGMGDVDQIEVVGEDISKVNFKFKTNKSPVIFWDQMFRKSFVERLLFHTPLFKMCIFASEFYHDKLWYNTTGRRHINRFMKTEWGKLWQKY